ncbi:MAG: response regulator [Pseudomonadota bacterium]|nr:response regulator [Pseudomonadota bacterium]
MPDTVVISVVDDDDSMRSSTEGLLRSFGFRVLTFYSAEEFLASDAGLKSDCVVSDIQMPGLGGFGLAERLSAGGGPPVILMTAFDTEKAASQAKKAGVRDFLRKPFTAQTLVAAIARALG